MVVGFNEVEPQLLRESVAQVRVAAIIAAERVSHPVLPGVGEPGDRGPAASVAIPACLFPRRCRHVHHCGLRGEAALATLFGGQVLTTCYCLSVHVLLPLSTNWLDIRRNQLFV